MASPSTSPSPDNNTALVFRSRIDWWLWAVEIMCVCVGIAVVISTPGWAGILCGTLIAAVMIVPMFGCYYKIVGHDLIVYNLFYPLRLPIGKIKDVRYVRGYLATAAMSTRRISIRFTDRSVLKSSMPIEISPADRDAFVAALRAINPDIEVLP